jgi:hypothetical protein
MAGNKGLFGFQHPSFRPGLKLPVLVEPYNQAYSLVGSTYTLDASAGNLFMLLLGANLTLSIVNNPTGSMSERVEIWFKQPAAGGPYTLTLGSMFTALPLGAPASIALSTVAGYVDKMIVEWNPIAGGWDIVSFINGYAG